MRGRCLSPRSLWGYLVHLTYRIGGGLFFLNPSIFRSFESGLLGLLAHVVDINISLVEGTNSCISGFSGSESLIRGLLLPWRRHFLFSLVLLLFLGFLLYWDQFSMVQPRSHEITELLVSGHAFLEMARAAHFPTRIHELHLLLHVIEQIVEVGEFLFPFS